MAVSVSNSAAWFLRIFSPRCVCQLTSTVPLRYSSTVQKKFYNNADILHSNGYYEISLDQTQLRTPKGNPVSVLSEPLALAVAAEWNAQQEIIDRSSMHLSALCCTVIDNPQNLTKFDIVYSIVNFLETDTVLFHSEKEDELYDLQKKERSPVINWFCQRFDVVVEPSRSIQEPVITNETKALITKHLLPYNVWSIYGLLFGVDVAKSIILTLGCAEKYLSIEKAVFLSRLEEEFQMRQWGKIEDAHDVSERELQAKLTAALLFFHLNKASKL